MEERWLLAEERSSPGRKRRSNKYLALDRDPRGRGWRERHSNGDKGSGKEEVRNHKGF